MVDARLGSTIDRLAIDDKPHQSDSSIPFFLFDFSGLEPCQASDSAEQHGTAGGRPGSSVGNFIRLKTIVNEIVLGQICLWVVAIKTVVCGNPQPPLCVLFDGGNAIFRQSSILRCQL